MRGPVVFFNDNNPGAPGLRGFCAQTRQKMKEIIVDLFAGGGGASEGIEQALGVSVDIAINHDAEAIAMHKANHLDTKHYVEDVFKVNPLEVTQGYQVGLLWASPDCTHFSRAKGGKPVKKKIRSLAWVVVHWAQLVKPRIIILENVSEFKTWGPLKRDNRPNKAKAGQTFNLWRGQLQNLGYNVEFRELPACDYGAPTIRKRLFMIARCDGKPIVWPQQTHAQPGNDSGLPNYRTAAECIDFSIPCPSIFERKRPLAENTLKRIARGIQKFVIDSDDPFIVKIGQTGSNGDRTSSVREPLRTIVSKAEDCLVVPSLSQVGYGERAGQQPRVMSIKKPLGTVVSTGKHALVTAFLSKYYSCSNPCANLNEPTPTVTAIDHNALVAAHLTKFYGTNTGSDMREPVPTVTATGQHLGEVRAFLVKYYNTNIGQPVNKPLHTITTKHRLGLVTVQGRLYQIADIGLRMLQPRELARAQGFDDSYKLIGTKTNQVAKIGNSVCPPLAKVLVAANVKLKQINKAKAG